MNELSMIPASAGDNVSTPSTGILLLMRIEVDSHTHTVASGHAYSTLAENTAAAALNGIRLLAVTDHGPAMPGAPHVWFFKNLRVIPRILNGVGLLRGVEANIINYAGETDIPQEIVRELDIVLGSLHEPVISPTTRERHTEAVVKAISSGTLDVFAHGGNPAFPIDVDEVAKAAAHYRVLVEINNSSFTTSRHGSKKNCTVLAEAVGRHDGWLTFGSDAHVADRVGVFEECRRFVTDLGFPQDRIVSCSAPAFLKFLVGKKSLVDFSGLDNLLQQKG